MGGRTRPLILRYKIWAPAQLVTLHLNGIKNTSGSD